MGSKSSIEWTATFNPDGSVTPGSTWNPVRGCTKVSPGCKHCYAETFAERWRGIPGHPYEQGFDLRLVPDKLDEPLRWKKPRRIFVNSMSDLFQDGVPFEFIDRVVSTMGWAKQHTYQILTKRPERMREYSEGLMRLTPRQRGLRIVTSMYRDHPARKVALAGVNEDNVGEFPWPLPNVWMGVSVENQDYLKRAWTLLETPAAYRFISLEPLLGPIDLHALELLCKDWRRRITIGKYLDWVIIGGESGPGARPFNVEWALDVVRQCKITETACFVKQLGSVPIISSARQNHWDWGAAIGMETRFEHFKEDPAMWRIRLKDRKGGDMSEWAQPLRVRQFPQVNP